MTIFFIVVVAPILSVILGLAFYYRKSPEERFVKKNYDKLRHYQIKIHTLNDIVNDKYSELPYKLQCAEETASLYTELQAFCYKNGGESWYCSACGQPEAESRRAVAELKKEAALLEERRSEIAQKFSKDDWRTYCDEKTHSLQGQGVRITRSYEEDIKIEAYNPAACLGLVRGASGKRYLTTFHECTCPDYKKRELPCKHIYCLCRLTAEPGFSAPFKIPERGLYGIGACVTGTFNYGTQEAVRTLLKRYLATVALSIEPTDFVLEGEKSVTTRAIQRATNLKLMQIREEDLLPMLETGEGGESP